MMYVGHPKCTWDIQTNIEAFQGVHYSQKRTWDTQHESKIQTDVSVYWKIYEQSYV